MTFGELKLKADTFFEWPSAERDHVTTTSALLFAQECWKAGTDAANTLPARVMFDEGVTAGRREVAEEIYKLIMEES